jgi:hypothetical protein
VGFLRVSLFFSATQWPVFAFSVFAFCFCCGGIREFVSVLHALPLCGAAPTFLCSGKEK